MDLIASSMRWVPGLFLLRRDHHHACLAAFGVAARTGERTVLTTRERALDARTWRKPKGEGFVVHLHIVEAVAAVFTGVDSDADGVAVHRDVVGDLHCSRLTWRSHCAALTAIYFLLASGEVSCWHRVRSDEVWHYLEGDPLELQIADPAFEHTTTIILGPYGGVAAPVCVVPAGWWQAARTTGAYTLVACTVGPGFDYDDFVMLRDLPRDVELLESKHPTLIEFV